VSSSDLFTAAKPAGYYGEGRADLIAELPRPLGRVLDVGCGEGGAGALLRAAGASELVGIEIEPEPAAVAASRYEHVEVGDAAEALDRLEGPFDTVLCYDVLEHLVEPAALLRQLRSMAAPGAHLHVSTPNARHWTLVRDLVVRGTFGYAEWGHRDATHLRWFTHRDLVALIEDAGWRVESATPSLAHFLRARRLPAPRRLVWWAGEFFAIQWFVLARA
jgi:2-polyprenyl-3-methyl-5-hydroxy-6-metoxy-1,4-benzoquinol methylase